MRGGDHVGLIVGEDDEAAAVSDLQDRADQLVATDEIDNPILAMMRISHWPRSFLMRFMTRGSAPSQAARCLVQSSQFRGVCRDWRVARGRAALCADRAPTREPRRRGGTI